MGWGTYCAGVSVHLSASGMVEPDRTTISQEDLSDASSLTGAHPTLLDKQAITLSHPEGKEGWKGVVLEPGKATVIGRREVCTLPLIRGVDRLTVCWAGRQWNYVSGRRYSRTRCLICTCTTRYLTCFPTTTA